MSGLASAGAPPPLVLEGEFTKWTKLWEWEIIDLYSLNTIEYTVDSNHVYVIWEDKSHFYRFAVLNLSDGSEVFVSPAGQDYTSYVPVLAQAIFYNTSVYLGVGASFSVLGKYFLIGVGGWEKFEVWKNGVKTFTSDIISNLVEGAIQISHGMIRYDGKYILLIPSMAKERLVCFEGS